jgi:hypothetical protein
MSNSAILNLRLIDHQAAGPPSPDDLGKEAVPLTSTLTAELDGAQGYLDVPAEEILLAAISRTIARTIGDTELAIDVDAGGECTVVVACLSARNASATEVLRAVHRSLASAHHHAAAPRVPASDVSFFYRRRTIPGPVSDGVLPPHETLPRSGHALEVRVYRTADGVVQMDWWYDTRRLDRYTVEEMTEQFPLALIDLTSDAVPPIREPLDLAMA